MNKNDKPLIKPAKRERTKIINIRNEKVVNTNDKEILQKLHSHQFDNIDKMIQFYERCKTTKIYTRRNR